MTDNSLPAAWSGLAKNFDAEAAAKLVGKYVLIGVTEMSQEGQELARYQMHGVIDSASAEGIKVSLKGTRDGQSWTMPPDPSGIQAVEPGRYGLRDTGEVIENPDLIAIWTVAKAQPQPPPQSG